MTAFDTTLNQVVLYGDDNYTSSATMLQSNLSTITSNSILVMDPSGANLHFIPLTSNLTFVSSLVYNFSPSDTQGYVRSGPGYTINYQVGGSNPSSYTKFGITVNAGQEELFLLNPIEKPSRYFKVFSLSDTTTTGLSNAAVRISDQILQDSLSNAINPTNVVGGGNGSKWLTFIDSPYIMGNRNDAVDAPITVQVAYLS